MVKGEEGVAKLMITISLNELRGLLRPKFNFPNCVIRWKTCFPGKLLSFFSSTIVIFVLHSLLSLSLSLSLSLKVLTARYYRAVESASL